MPTTANTITYYVAADGTLRDGPQGSISQQPRLNYGTDYAVTLSFPAGTLQEGDQLQVALNRTRTFFSSASATGDAPVAAVVKHDVTAEEAAAQTVEVVLSTNTRAMIDQVNGIDHPVRGFFGVHILRGQSFVTLAVADALMMSLESGPDAISPSLPVVDYPTREEAEALTDRSEAAANRAEQAAAGIVPPLQLSAPPTTSTAGSVGQLAVYHDTETDTDHLYHLVYITTSDSATLYHWEECVLFQSDGLVSSTILPLAKNSGERGAIIVNASYGTYMMGNRYLSISSALNNDINLRTNAFRPIVSNNLDYAVRSVLPNITEIPAATSDYSLVDSSATTLNHSHTFSHVPTQAPTYRLPSVSDTTVSHYIELTVDFTNVQTYSFLDANGDALVPLFTPSIAAGDVYTFRMEYSAIKAKWLIYPQKQGAVADDFVMRGEVGAANGVATLDANTKVLRNVLPIATTNEVGAGKAHPDRGINVTNGNYFSVVKASSTDIDSRGTGTNISKWEFKPIVPNNLNYAVTAALTDSNKISLTDAQKAAAQEVFGVGGPITEIPAATSEYTLSEGIFKHAPTNAPTYNLPSITDTIRSHVIVLAIDFSSVQTFSFVPPQDSGVTFQSYANPNLGDVWVFRCVWYGGKWRICPMKIKNCVTRQLTSGALSITDAIAGDALALKMVAPRSVVVNQLVDWVDTLNQQSLVGYNASCTYSSDCATITTTTSTTTKGAYFKLSTNWNPEHVYLAKIEAKSDSYTGNISLGSFNIGFNGGAVSSSWTTHYVRMNSSHIGSGNSFLVSISSTETAIDIKNAQIIDLTQYFNGDSTLIDSITSWDDLVAYDSRFASYVEYNTGTVTGVQPQVKVMGKNLFDKSRISTDYSYTGDITTVDSRNCVNVWNARNDHSHEVIIPMQVKGAVTFSCYGKQSSTNPCSFAIQFQYLDGSIETSYATLETTWVNVSNSSNNAKILKAIRLYNGGNNISHGGYIDIDTIQLEFGSSATSYEPYHDGGSAQAPSELFAVGNAADEYEAVAGTLAQTLKQVDLSTLTWTAGDGTYSATITDIKPSTLNFLLPNGYVGSVSGTTLTITASATPTGTMVYEKATKSTTDVTPVQIDLQSGSNTAMQTDGGRLAPIDVTYESNEI